MALGAAAGRMMRLVLVRVAVLVATGTIVGITLSLWLSQFVASLLYGVQPHDTATWTGAFVVLASVGLVAGAIPARKAARTNPATVLRES
jgi:ABC-type antimicrobial peptide transport system permease subunit